MLESIAFWYISQSDIGLRLLFYGIAVAGGVLAAFLHTSSALLSRARYFAYFGVFLFMTAAAQLVWLDSISAMAEGYLWVLVLADLGVAIAFGYALAVVAMARSRDAYGHARLAVLAFLPIANLWLFAAPSRRVDSSGVLPRPAIAGWVGALVGFIALVGYVAVVDFIRKETSRIAAAAGSDPAVQQAGLAVALREQGLEETLRQLAAEVPRQQIDDTTVLLRGESRGTTLSFQYESSIDAEALPIPMRLELTQNTCTFQFLRPLLESGAVIEHVYLRPDGSEIETVTITRQLCGY